MFGQTVTERFGDMIVMLFEPADPLAAQKKACALSLVRQLTSRDYDVLRGIVSGCSSQEIGSVNDMSFEEVERCRSRIIKRFGVRYTADVVRIALEADVESGSFHLGGRDQTG